MKNKSKTKIDIPEEFKTENVDCYNCGSNDFEYFLTGEDDLTGKEGRFQYVKCQKCGLVYQNPRIKVDQIKAFYDSEYIAHRKKTNWGILTPLYEWAMNKHDRDKVKLVKKYSATDESTEVIDIGCAVGSFLLYLNKQHGCKISGVDFKDGFDYPGFEKIDFFSGLFYEQDFGDKKYDLITMWHFLEHCYDPNQTLQTAKTILNKGGKVIIEVPRLDSLTFKLFGSRWPGVQAPQHTVLYDKKNFLEMIEKNGFKVKEYLPYGAFPSYFYIFTGMYFKLIGKNLNLNKIIFPYFLGQALLTPILLLNKHLNLCMQTVVCEKIEE